MRAQFIMSEMGVGLRRNLTMTVAVVLTVAISLALLGTGWLMRQQVNTMKGYWYGKIEVSVFLSKNVTPAERQNIYSSLVGLPQVQRVYYESQQEAWQHFQQDFKNEPELIKNTDPSVLPESFRVKLKDPRQYAIVDSAMAGVPGVDEVKDQSQVLKPFFSLMNGLQVAAWSVAILALVAAALLVFNTIRVAAFSRRRETGIMRLVGASTFYIQLPFILEGAFAGLLGGALATGGLVGLKAWLVDGRIAPHLAFLNTSLIGWDVVWQTVPFLVVLGVLLSAIASFLTLQRYVRV